MISGSAPGASNSGSPMKAPMILALALASSPGAASAHDAASEPSAYCSEIKRVAALAATKERFASIAGKPREGNFVETTLPLTSWRNCALYGAATYTCGSREHDSAEEAERVEAELAWQIKSCLGEGWAIATARSSASYVVLHDVTRPISITLSTDETADKKHIVHLILFVRGN
jgi:hypothetical protein